MTDKTSVTVLVADDDPDDCLLMQEAFHESRLANPLRFVHDGEQLLHYLRRHPPYNDDSRYPMPGLILLDLNMPRMDGREALIAIKTDPRLRSIPVVILSTSSESEDILRSYASGVNSFISKPTSFSRLLEVVHTLGRYWLGLVELPEERLNL